MDVEGEEGQEGRMRLWQGYLALEWFPTLPANDNDGSESDGSDSENDVSTDAHMDNGAIDSTGKRVLPLSQLADEALRSSLEEAATERAKQLSHVANGAGRVSKQLSDSHVAMLDPCAGVLANLHRQDISKQLKSAALRFAGLSFNASPQRWSSQLPQSVVHAFKMASISLHNPLGSGLCLDAKELSAVLRESAQYQRERLHEAYSELHTDRLRLGSESHAVCTREKALQHQQLHINRLERFADAADDIGDISAFNLGAH